MNNTFEVERQAHGDSPRGGADHIAAAPTPASTICALFPECGGCALQHLPDPEYASRKEGRLGEALRRAGFATPLVAPLIRTPARARRRMDLAVRREADGAITIGLNRARSHAIVDMTECHILVHALFALLAPLRTVLRGVSALRRDGALVINGLDSGPDILLRTEGALSAGDRSALARFAETHRLPRVSWARGAGEAETAVQLAPVFHHFVGVRVVPQPGAFLQASREGEAAIVDAVLAALPAKLGRRPVLDLYAGLGTLSFPLAERVRVRAYEGFAPAASALRQAAAGRRVEVFARDLARQPLSVSELREAAAVVLDPPHAGAPAQMGALAAARVPVIYVSCNPDALARDARVLAAAGYRMAGATPVDQFVWSESVEAVVAFAPPPSG